MIIDRPTQFQIPEMKALWLEAFGDTSEFVDKFFEVAYSPDRCRVLSENGEVASVLYVFDCEYRGEKTAYIYAVATAKKYRGRGFCPRLMEDTHEYLKDRGYAFALLHPGDESLFEFYRRIGYKTCGWVSEISAESSDVSVNLKGIGKDEYARLRRTYLSENGVLQERENLSYLASYTSLYSFDGGIFTAFICDGELFSAEILTDSKVNEDVLGGIVNALGCTRGTFRTIGDDVPFVMGYPLCREVPERVEFTLALE